MRWLRDKLIPVRPCQKVLLMFDSVKALFTNRLMNAPYNMCYDFRL